MPGLRTRNLGFEHKDIAAKTNLLLYVEQGQAVRNVPLFFKYLRSLGVKNIILFGDFPILSEFLNNYENDFKKQTDFEFSILFRPHLPSFLRQNIQKIDQFLLPRLFCNVHYFKRHTLLTKEVFHFFGLHPEVIKADSAQNSLSLLVKNSEDVDSVFLLSDRPQTDIYEEVMDITDRLDIRSGLLKMTIPPLPNVRIVVLRRFYFDGQTALSHLFNYYDATAFAALQKWFKSHLLKLPIPFKGVVYNLEEMFDIAQKFSGVSYSANLEKVLKGIKKTIAFYFANTQNQPIHNIFLSIVFKRYFNSMLRPRFNVLAPQVKYLIHSDSYLAQLLDLNQQFIVKLDLQEFEIDTPYYLKTIGSLKRAESQLFAETNGHLPVLAYRLLGSPFSVPRQKYYIDLLAQAGVTEFWWQANMDESLPDDNQNEFITYKIKYASQLGTFLARGLPVGQILMLYPSLDQSQQTFRRILRDLHFSGVPFELLSFDLFNSNQYCKIEEGKINFNQKTFRLVLLPAIQVLPFATLKKLMNFFSKGGQIVAIQKIPAQVELRNKQKYFETIRKNLWIVEPDLQSITFLQNDNKGKSWFIPKLNLLKDFLRPYIRQEAVYVDSPKENILMRMRETHEAYFIFLTNPSQKETCRPVLQSNKSGFPFYWDFKKQIPKPIHHWNLNNKRLSIPLTLRPMESKLIILQKEMATDVWHIGFCDAQECHVFSPKPGTFVVQLYNDDPGPVQLHLEKKEKHLKVPVHIKENLNEVILSRDHWILLAQDKKHMIHLDDLPKVAFTIKGPFTLQKTFLLREFRRDRSYYLDLGRAEQPCRIHINGQTAGRLWHYPFRAEISHLLQAGENILEIELVDITSQNNLTPSAAFSFPDPLRLIPYHKIFIQAEEMSAELS